jgi:DNA polymerase-1
LARLQERTTTEQFFQSQHATTRALANLEFDGIEVDIGRIDRLTDSALDQFGRLKSQIVTIIRKECDIDSQEEVFEVLRETAMVRGYVGPRKTAESSLEYLAMVEPVARLVVESKRLRRRAARLKSISSAVRDGRIYPLFNQIKSRTGMVASSDPSIFDLDGSLDLKSCFDDKISDLFADAKTSLKVLAEITKDPLLIKHSSRNEGGQIIEDISATRELDLNDAHLLLRLAIAESDLPLAKRYLDLVGAQQHRWRYRKAERLRFDGMMVT